ncbi:sensor histidine kinase [Lachnoclostridium sp.]|uniref:sensor histidine kinase n=1 Tax=Lachnoclostridium sp. TaxID=2028282 RepID=UPI0028A2ABB9|nr:sensor histidine kinase [Lachnoclostridium sp.]
MNSDLLSKFFKRQIKKLDNYTLKKKLYFLYFFCVAIPVIVTNGLILKIVYDSEKASRKRNLENIAEAVEYNITSSFSNAVTITNDMYTNRIISKFLDTVYTSPYDYYSAYDSLKRNYILHQSLGLKISNVILYADNDTITNGGKFAKVSEITNTEWYQYLSSSGRNLIIFPYYDYNKTNLYTHDTGRTISIIRKLDYYGKNSLEKIVKLDVDYSIIQKDITNTKYDAKVYVCDGDNIIFSNDGITSGSKEFSKWNEGNLKGEYAEKQMHLYSRDWDIYIVGYQSNMIERLRDNIPIFFILILANLLLPITIMYLVNQSNTRRIFLLGEYLDKVKEEKFDMITGEASVDEIGYLIKNYNLMVLKMEDLIQVVYKDKLERQELNLAKQQAELLALHSQINPHFMFNALESIRMRSLIKNEDETAHIIGKLAILMRKSVDWGADTITIKEEMDFVEAYLQLQRYRFGNKLLYQIQVEEACLRYKIPKLTILTFVENSCVHGIESMSNEGWIFIYITENEGSVTIEVEDTGIGMTEEQAKKLQEYMNGSNIETIENSESIGILNACVRLRMFCGEKFNIKIDSEDKVGTTIVIKLPIITC